MPSYYELLGVEPDADQAAIRAAYMAALRATPHHDGIPPARDRRLDEAIAVLGEPERRARYDELVATDGARGNPELLALLGVIADTGTIPTAEDVLEPPSPDLRSAIDHRPHVEVDARPVGAELSDAPEPHVPNPAPLGTAASAPVPGTDGTRRDLGWRRSLLAVVVVAVLVGAAAGLLLAGRAERSPTFTIGGCVAVEGGSASPVACGDTAATARIADVVDEPTDCNAAELGTLDLGADGVACLEPVAP
jgi:hypothetical protein